MSEPQKGGRSDNYASMSMWRDSLRRIPSIGFCLAEIRGAGPCRRGDHTLHGCVRWSPIRRMRTWRAWRLPGRWPDRGRRSSVARWTRRRAAPACAPIPDMFLPERRGPGPPSARRHWRNAALLLAAIGRHDALISVSTHCLLPRKDARPDAGSLPRFSAAVVAL